jgi:hypothetical protein
MKEKTKIKIVDILDILVTVGLCMVVLALFELLMNNWLSALYIGSIGTLLCAAHCYSLPTLKKVAAKPAAVVTLKKVTKRRKAWKFPKIPMPPKWVFVSAGRILGLLLAILVFALLCKGIWWALTGTGTHAVAVVLPPPPIAVVAVAAPVAPMVSVAPGGKLAIASGGGLAMVDSSITINNTVTTTTQATPPQIEVMPYREPTQLPEPSPTAEFTETRVIIQPGCYQTYVPPRECNLYAYWPEVDHNAIQIYYDGRPGIPYGPILVRQSYGYRNNGSHPVGMTMRVMRQPGGQGWHR